MGCGKSKPQAPAPVLAQQTDPTLLNQTAGENQPEGTKVQPESPKVEKPEVPPKENQPTGTAEADAGKEQAVEAVQVATEASQPTTVKIEVIGARGLHNADLLGKSEPYCIVEIAGKPESRIQTEKSTNAKEPEWNHAAEVAGYMVGSMLVFTVKDSDPLKDDVLGKATATEEQIRMGYIGELPLTEAGEGVEAFLKVKVGEPGLLEEAKDAVLETLDEVQEAVDEAKEAIDEKIQETKEAIDDKVQEVRATLNEALEKVEETVEATGVQIDDETKAVFCRC